MYVFVLPNPNRDAIYLVFLKILKPHATFIFHVKLKRSCTDDGDTWNDHKNYMHGFSLVVSYVIWSFCFLSEIYVNLFFVLKLMLFYFLLFQFNI